MTSPDVGGHKPRLEYGEGSAVRGRGSSVPRSNQPGYEVGVPVDRGILAPTPGGELPIAQQVAEHYRRVLVKPEGDLDPSDERIGAWHGTSVQTLLDATTTGRLRGFSSDQPDAMYQQGDLSVYPTAHVEVPEGILSPEREPMDDATAHYMAEGHAIRIGAEHGFLTELGIPLSDAESSRQAGTFLGVRDVEVQQPPQDYFRAEGFSDHQLAAASANAQDQEGVLLGISRDVAHDPRVAIVPGFAREGDVTLRTIDGQGLPVDLVAIVQPRGEKDARMLQEGLAETAGAASVLEEPQVMKDREPSKVSRRRLLLGGASIAALAALDQGPRLLEASPQSQSEIVFGAGQTQRLAETGKACLIFNGAAFRRPDSLLEWLTPALEPLGAVGGTVYAKHGLDTPSIARDVRLLQQHGANEFSLFLHSSGAQVAGKVFEEMDGDIKLNHVLMDCTPPSLSYTDYPRLANTLSNLPYDGGAILTGGLNWAIYGKPIATEAAYPGLLWDQIETMRDGEQHIASLARVANRSGAKVTLLTPQQPEKDTNVNIEASRIRLAEFFPTMKVSPIGGPNQQHGVSPANMHEYRAAITKAIEA